MVSSAKGGTHPLDLAEHPVDELRPIAAADDQLLDPRPQDAALDPKSRSLADVTLGVDHKHPAGGHDDVVDVRLRPGDASIVQDPDRLARVPVEPRAQRGLSLGARCPRLRALRIVGQRKNQTSELRMPGADLVFTPGLAPFVLPLGRGTGGSALVCRWLRLDLELTEFPFSDLRLGRAFNAPDRLGSALVDGLLACG
jgi:hypothetical protein